MASKKQRKSLRSFWGLWLGFIVLIAFLAKGLQLNPYRLPSHEVSKPFPAFQLRTLQTQEMMQREQLLGTPSLVHIWATWCGVCLKEHQTLLTIKRQWQPKIIGVSYKDQPGKVLAWLEKSDDPYDLLIGDPGGELALELGVTGTPETYLIDSQGVIRYRHVGPLSEAIFTEKLLPLLSVNTYRDQESS